MDTWWCGSIMVWIGTLLNLAVRDNYTTSILAGFASFRRHSNSASTHSLSHVSQFLLKCFTDLKSHNTSLTTASPPPPSYSLRGCAPSMAAVMHCSSGPEGCRHAWERGLLLWIILFDVASVGQEGDRVPCCQMCCTPHKCSPRYPHAHKHLSEYMQIFIVWSELISSSCSYSEISCAFQNRGNRKSWKLKRIIIAS